MIPYLLAAVLGFTLTPVVTAAAITRGQDDATVDATDRYIITLRPNVNLDQHLQSVEQLHTSEVDSAVFEGISTNFTIGDLTGYAGHFPNSLITHLQSHPEVSRVESDGIAQSLFLPHRISSRVLETQEKSPYGLGLISHRDTKAQSQGYIYDSSAGKGTFSYILDTGILTTHSEFEGRATLGFDATKDTKHAMDANGAGTAAASIVGGKTYGVAKKTSLISVRVLHPDGKALYSTVIDGLRWTVKDVVEKKRAATAVVNLSVGFADRPPVAVQDAILAAEKAGLTVVMGAGNEGKDAMSGPCAPTKKMAFCVAATDKNRKRAKWSNHGAVVTLYAPGVQIESAWVSGPNAKMTGDGTGYAAAYVAGLVVYAKALWKTGDVLSTRRKLEGELALRGVVQEPKPDPLFKPKFAYNGSGK
ncbi:hypothetical protein ANO11243_094060 [Dothideomycetidae sp. 11243]|nr:hypothetical protein ANO11243_094060 [fungal sp. No.11243]